MLVFHCHMPFPPQSPPKYFQLVPAHYLKLLWLVPPGRPEVLKCHHSRVFCWLASEMLELYFVTTISLQKLGVLL